MELKRVDNFLKPDSIKARVKNLEITLSNTNNEIDYLKGIVEDLRLKQSEAERELLLLNKDVKERVKREVDDRQDEYAKKFASQFEENKNFNSNLRELENLIAFYHENSQDADLRINYSINEL